MNQRAPRFPVVILLIAAALALPACGNKGPLVLPDEPDQSTTPAGDTGTDDATPAGEPAAGETSDDTPDDTPDTQDAAGDPAAPPPEDG